MNARAAKSPAALPGRRFRLPLRFSLRTFLAAITILCVVLGWRVNRASRQRDAVAAIRAAGGAVHYDYQQPSFGPEHSLGETDFAAQPSEPDWLLALLGIDFFHHVTAVNLGSERPDRPVPVNIASHLARFPRLRTLWLSGEFIGDAELAIVGRLGRLEILACTSAAISDDGVAHLGNLPCLRHVELYYPQPGDRSLATLARLPNLEVIRLPSGRLTSAGLQVLVGHRRLRKLNLGGRDKTSALDDDALAHLAQVPQLEELELAHTRISPAGLERLQTLASLRYLDLRGSSADDYATVAPLFPNCRVVALKRPPRPWLHLPFGAGDAVGD